MVWKYDEQKDLWLSVKDERYKLYIYNECYLFVVVICKIKNVMIDMFFASIVLFLVCLDMIGTFVIFCLLYYSLYLRLVTMMRWTRIWRICLSRSLKSPMKGLHKDNILAAWYLYLLKANTDYRAAFLFCQINEEFIRIILFMFPVYCISGF